MVRPPALWTGVPNRALVRLVMDRSHEMARRIALLCLVVLLGAGVVASDFGLIFSDYAAAEAQRSKKDRPGLFERLFGQGKKDPPKKVVPTRKSSPSKRRVSPPSSSRKKSTPTRRSTSTTSSRKATTVPTASAARPSASA